MLTVGGEPVEAFGAVVDGMEAPEETDAVLQAMAPVDEKVAQQNNFDGLEPPGLRSDGLPETVRNDAAEPVAEIGKDQEDEAIPEEILAEEEPQVGEPGGTKEALPTF